MPLMWHSDLTCVPPGRERNFLNGVIGATMGSKKHLAVGAWGKRGTVTLHLKESVRLSRWLDRMEKSFLDQVKAGTNTTSSLFIHHKMWNVYEYFNRLREYKFLIAPQGGGVQSPKILEALMVLTIPVTKRLPCFQQLQEYGFPIVLVDDWDDITEELLNDVCP